MPTRCALRAARAVALVVAALVAACGGPRDVRARYPSTPGESTGALVLQFSRDTSDVVIAVNGVLVVDGAETRRVRIDGVATGYADVAIAAGPMEKQTRVWVEQGRDTVLPVGSAGPGGSALDGVKQAVLSLGAMLLYAYLKDRW